MEKDFLKLIILKESEERFNEIFSKILFLFFVLILYCILYFLILLAVRVEWLSGLLLLF